MVDSKENLKFYLGVKPIASAKRLRIQFNGFSLPKKTTKGTYLAQIPRTSESLPCVKYFREIKENLRPNRIRPPITGNYAQPCRSDNFPSVTWRTLEKIFVLATEVCRCDQLHRNSSWFESVRLTSVTKPCRKRNDFAKKVLLVAQGELSLGLFIERYAQSCLLLTLFAASCLKMFPFLRACNSIEKLRRKGCQGTQGECLS